MPYRVGYCPTCDTQVMVRDTIGKWTTRKPNFREIDLYFEDGARIRSIICSECFGAPDYEKLMGAMTHVESNAFPENIKPVIKKMGLPLSHKQAGVR